MHFKILGMAMHNYVHTIKFSNDLDKICSIFKNCTHIRWKLGSTILVKEKVNSLKPHFTIPK